MMVHKLNVKPTEWQESSLLNQRNDPGLVHIQHNEFYQHIETILHPHELLPSPSGIAPPGHSPVDITIPLNPANEVNRAISILSVTYQKAISNPSSAILDGSALPV
jgi:hypothetical protein